MPAYKPGQGVNAAALERLRARKTEQAGVADVPAEDKSEQWDRLLGVAAKKKLRCGVCTRPLSEQDQMAKRIVCLACESTPASSSAASGGLSRQQASFVSEEFGKDLFYFCLRAAPPQPAAPQQERAAGAAAGETSSAADGPKTQRSVPALARGASISESLSLVPRGRAPLSVLSFNLLADCYVRVEGQPWNAFAHCEGGVLAWEARLPLIRELLQSCAADVVCLQEVVMEWRVPPGSEKEEWCSPAWMAELEGYAVVVQGFKQKEWEGQAERNQRVCGVKAPTGVATLYSSARFKEWTPPKHGSGSGLTVFLRSLEPASDAGDATLDVAVGNVHLAGDPSKSAEHVKALGSLKKNLGKRDLCLVCGDFNSECAPTSDVGRWFAEEGFIEAPTGSSWAEPGNGQRLDHIFHSRGLMAVAASGDLPPEEVASGLPCGTCPSDHAPVSTLFAATVRGRCPW
mmetsp:Transcript_41284/g.119409  ORF Transcript_41284/g.119409 Transcript_41284/m.119409 type:complete len:459 (-) Transcript_41284:73-1449(-)